ncbi:MAG: hypothetical protein AAFR21_16825 [Pseudomonadota bacterium]
MVRKQDGSGGIEIIRVRPIAPVDPVNTIPMKQKEKIKTRQHQEIGRNGDGNQREQLQGMRRHSFEPK